MSDEAAFDQHLVHFYDDDHDLVSLVVDYIRAGLLHGGVAVVIATADHRSALNAALDRTEIDVSRARFDGRLIELDAAESLASFMDGESPDPGEFDRTIGGVVRRAARTGGPVRAYGEMVGLLWEDGNACGAVELERLWNELGHELSFSLFCGYPTSAVAVAGVGPEFAEVCRLHDRVVAGAPSWADAECTQRFAGSIDGPRLARQFVTDTLIDWHLDDAVDSCALLVSELATNAVLHARSDFTVSLTRLDGDVHVAVGDKSAAPPLPRAASPSDVGGRGLQIVQALASHWGHSPDSYGKLVWARLPVEA